MSDLEDIAREQVEWERQDVEPVLKRVPERKADFTTLSGLPVERVYTPADVGEGDFLRDVGFPGRYPYTRGPYPTMHRGRPWTMRQIAGYGTPSDTNQRLKYLIAQGQTGISVDFDMPTLMGYDSDDPRSLGEVGREGVAIGTWMDVDELLEGIDVGSISVSMTINPTAWILFSMYLAMADSRGVSWDRLSGTVQADILKEYIAQKEWIYPIPAGMRLVRDIIVFSAKHLPHYNPINISGYHIREAGATAAQEAAFTLANGIAYVEDVVKTGMAVDEFGPRLAFYFVAERDFLEEIAKFRASRRVWARVMKERFGAQRAESMRLRFHCQTAAMSLTTKQPINNVVRTAIEALAAVLGGAQSLHTNGMDEAYAIPSEAAMKVALRTQQIILEETGVASTIDALGGSYAIEALTNRMEEEIWEYIRRIDELGGAAVAAERNFQQAEIAESAYQYMRKKEDAELVQVGINKYVDPEDEGLPFEVHRVDPGVEQDRRERLHQVREGRDNSEVARCLKELAKVARTDENVIPATLAAVKAQATMGEIVRELKDVFGTYVETPVF